VYSFVVTLLSVFEAGFYSYYQWKEGRLHHYLCLLSVSFSHESYRCLCLQLESSKQTFFHYATLVTSMDRETKQFYSAYPWLVTNQNLH
jgi:hypothetical protein